MRALEKSDVRPYLTLTTKYVSLDQRKVDETDDSRDAVVALQECILGAPYADQTANNCIQRNWIISPLKGLAKT
jgi:hypothetical protein